MRLPVHKKTHNSYKEFVITSKHDSNIAWDKMHLPPTAHNGLQQLGGGRTSAHLASMGWSPMLHFFMILTASGNYFAENHFSPENRQKNILFGIKTLIITVLAHCGRPTIYAVSRVNDMRTGWLVAILYGRKCMSHAILHSCVAIAIHAYRFMSKILIYIKMPHDRRYTLYLGCQRSKKSQV